MTRDWLSLPEINSDDDDDASVVSIDGNDGAFDAGGSTVEGGMREGEGAGGKGKR